MGKVTMSLGSMVSGAKENKQTLTLTHKNDQATQVSALRRLGRGV